jgi:hypothetical protein
MVARVTKLRETGDPVPETDERLSQRKRPENGRYWLQVDRQTKASFATAETAQAAGLSIKARHPIVQVNVYDSVDCQNTLVELPAAKETGA